ncbi:C4-dicarboxylate ABC transporter substrate-binding protein [Salipiger sp. IMCC34102]|uniref:TRAP transporter substrate-binding protein n=1 Tax=Salipiger sp. IMCC34102 TaxID=2510647 RepID=UPI00101BA21A|nr:TRAP transporter substrate-binding protein [Salipiger sp. IMCC34102]RYH03523.1 C4-dicarboxylate ABC transporter substrate-binding protein [Salipiger sp. IMCC34102]
MYRFATLVAATGVLATPALAQSWDMPTPYGDSTFHTQNIRQFAEDVSAATDGALEITVHSAGSLFPGGEIKNAVRSRQVPIGEFFLSSIVNEDAAYGMDSLPFLATSYEEAEALWTAQEPVITELLAEQDLVPLFSVPWPAQGLYTNGEIETIDGMTGLRMRAYNAALEEFATLAGAAPVQVEAADIPQAFATGQVQAMITSPSTGANSSAWDFVDTYTAIDAWLPKNIVVVNARVFDGLSEEMQQAVMEAAEAAEARGIEMSREETAAQTAVLEENGMTLAAPTDELTSGLQDIGDTMLENWESSASEPALEILNAYQSE